MTKQHLGIFAIVTVSLIMGLPPMMAEADKPVEVSRITSQDICDAEICEGNINVLEICGQTDSILWFEYLSVTYSYGKDKFKTVESTTGNFKIGDTVIGTIDESTTTIGHYDKGAQVKQIHAKVHCTDDSIERDHDVTVTLPSK